MTNDSRQLLHRQRGSAHFRNAVVRVFGREFSTGLINVTWPFATLECYSDRLSVGGPIKVTIPVQDIEVIEVKHSTLLRIITLTMASALIHHHGEGPNPVLFRGFSIKKAVRVFDQLGLKVVPGSSKWLAWWPWW